MAWEERNGNRYYYRKERDGDRVRSVYVGGDEVAAVIADVETADRKRRKGLRAIDRIECEEQQTLDRQIDEVIGLAGLLADAAMIEAGYHRHKGQWRRQRERDTDN